jgi:exopolysaccharide biosynthesis polyprenyl glycosylphosphotransferase
MLDETASQPVDDTAPPLAPPQAPLRPQVGELWPSLRLRLSLSNLSLYLSERKLLLAAMDLALLNSALYFALLLRKETNLPRFEPTTVSFSQELTWYIVLTGLWFLIGSLFEVYDLALAASVPHSLKAAWAATALTILIYIFIPYVTPSFPIRRLEAFLFLLFALGGIGLWRAAYALILVQPNFHQRALVIGAGWSGRTVVQAIKETGFKKGNPYYGTGYTVLGFVDDNSEIMGTEVEGVRVIGSSRDLMRLVQELHPAELIVAITDTRNINSELFQTILACHQTGVHVTSMASLYERMTGRVPIEHAGRNLQVFLPVEQPATFRTYLLIKRGLDIVSGSAGCVLMAGVTPGIWLLNHMISPGPLFYWQDRVGKGGSTFRLFKFRSMVVDAERDIGAVWASDDDPRVTAVGRFLRRTRLDELPQSLNVLRGDMSLVGPRPERPEFEADLARDIPFYAVRHAVQPGLTGWAQVNYHYTASVEETLVKLQYDLHYLKHQGLLLDLRILMKTIGVVLGFRGV